MLRRHNTALDPAGHPAALPVSGMWTNRKFLFARLYRQAQRRYAQGTWQRPNTGRAALHASSRGV